MTEGSKVCNGCKRSVPLERFDRASKRPDGRYSICKACRKRRTDPARKSERGRAYYMANRARILAYGRQWYLDNREYALEHYKAWRRANPRTKLVKNEYMRRVRAAAAGVRVGEFTLEDVQARLSMFPGCWICGDQAANDVDHVKPVSKGGAHLLCNLRKVCERCNSSKGNTWPYVPPPR